MQRGPVRFGNLIAIGTFSRTIIKYLLREATEIIIWAEFRQFVCDDNLKYNNKTINDLSPNGAFQGH